MAVPQAAVRRVPAWVLGGGVDPVAYPPAQFLTGYGLSSPGGSEVDRREQALAQAREALAASIRVRVSSEFTSGVAQRDQQMTHFAQNLVRTKADLELDGLDTFQTWTDEKTRTCHALAVLDKDRTLRLMAGRTASEAAECARNFEEGRRSGDPSALLQAKRLRERLEESLLVDHVLSGGLGQIPDCPTLADIRRELRGVYSRMPGLEGYVAKSALDLDDGLPHGLRLLVDRITFADTPFCGTFSAYLEQALAGDFTSLGQSRIVDKAGARDAIHRRGLDSNLAEALRSQAVVSGTCFDLGDEVKLNLRVTSAGGEELAATSQSIPAALIRQSGLHLVPDNFQSAQQILAIDEAKIQASTLKVKVALDRGDGGIYREGDKLYLFIKANADCFAKVIYQQVDGTKVLLFPNKFHRDSQLKKGQLYQIPPDDHSFDLVVQEPFGAELVKVIASTEPIDLEGRDPDGNGLSQVREDLATVLDRTRGIRLEKADAQYAEDTAVVNTMGRVN